MVDLKGTDKMTKIVYNACYGGFSLSHEAIMRYAEIKGLTVWPEKGPYGSTTYYLVPPDQRTPDATVGWHQLPMEERIRINQAHSREQLYDRDIDRADPALAQVVEELGSAANGPHAKLRIEDVPVGPAYRIDEYEWKRVSADRC